MADGADINTTLKKKIAALSTEIERLGDDLSSKEKSLESDFSTQTIDIIKSILYESNDADIETLQTNRERLAQLSTYVQQADLGKEEKTVLTSCIKTTVKFVEKKIKEKNNILKKATDIVNEWTQNAGSMVEGVVGAAFGNDPLMNLAAKSVTKTGGFLKNTVGKVIANKAGKANAQGLKNTSLKDDAKLLLDKKVTPEMPVPEPPDAPKKPGRGNPDGGSGNKPDTDNDGRIYLGKIESLLETISLDVKSLITLPTILPDIQSTLLRTETLTATISDDLQNTISLFQDLIEEMSYANLENERERKKQSPSNSPAISPKNLPITPSSDGDGGGFISTMLGVLGGNYLSTILIRYLGPLARGLGVASVAALVGGAIALRVSEGIAGWLKGPEWGTSRISAAIGGFLGGTGKNATLRIFSSMGSFALLGAKMGSMAVPGYGTVIGGIVGAMLGGLVGWMGGAKLTQWFDEFGFWIKETFTNGIEAIKIVFTNMWDTIKSMFLDVSDGIDIIKVGILDWISNMLKNIMKNDPTGLASKYLGSTQAAIESEKGQIRYDMAERELQRRELEKQKLERLSGFNDRIRTQEADRLERENTYRIKNAEYYGEDDTNIPRITANIPESEKLKIQGYAISPEVLSAIKAASDESGIDVGYMMSMAAQESSFNPNARATKGTASGLYQFINDTATAYMKKLNIDPKDRMKPEVQAKMAAAYAVDNKRALQGVKSGEVTNTDLYLGHFLGTPGAIKFLRNMQKDGNIPAARLFPEQAKFNPPTFYDKNNRAKSLFEVYSELNKKVGSKSEMWAKEFNNRTSTQALTPKTTYSMSSSNSGIPKEIRIDPTAKISDVYKMSTKQAEKSVQNVILNVDNRSTSNVASTSTQSKGSSGTPGVAVPDGRGSSILAGIQ